ncbi:hypothetical protein DBR40_16140 [Pedobacter sp. KBW01]|nr:hypothetical protein DBR40_16140 [Pedobacter sp. KBW01]
MQIYTLIFHFKINLKKNGEVFLSISVNKPNWLSNQPLKIEYFFHFFLLLFRKNEALWITTGILI